MRATCWMGTQHRRGQRRPRPEDPQPPRRDREDHLDRDLRLGPAPLRRLHPDHGEGRHPRPRVHGRGRRGRPRRDEPQGGRPGRRAVPDRLRRLLRLPARAVLALRELQSQRGDGREDCWATPTPGSSATRTSPAAYAGGQAEYARVPFADVGPIKIEDDLPDEQVLFLSDIFPTGYMGAEMCDIKPGDVDRRLGRRPGRASSRSPAPYLLGAERVIAIDRFDYRLQMAREQGRRRDHQLRGGRHRRRQLQGDDRRPRAGCRASTPSAWRPTPHGADPRLRPREAGVHAGDRPRPTRCAKRSWPAGTAARSRSSASTAG